MSDYFGPLLLQVFGERLLAYVTAVSPVELGARLSGSDVFSPSQDRTLGELAQLVNRSDVKAQDDFEISHNVIAILGNYYEPAETTVVNALRLQSDGELWGVPSTDDPVESAVLALLRDVHPLMYMPSDSKAWFGDQYMKISSAVFRHPLNGQFEAAVLADETLKMLYPLDTESSGPHGGAFTSSGNGSSLQLWGMASKIIATAWEWASLQSLAPSVADCASGVRWILAAIRSALRKESATMPVRIALTGVLLPEGVADMVFDWGRIRGVHEFDRNGIAEQFLPGGVRTTVENGETVTVNYRGDIIVEMEIPFRVKLADVLTHAGGMPSDLNPWPSIEQRMQNVRLGLLLATVEVLPRALTLVSWQKIVDPLLFSAVGGVRSVEMMRNVVSPRRLTVGQVSEWKQWVQRLAEHRTPSINVAISRALLAVSERSSPEDMLVDAVVVWENLFGSNQETTMRVTGSLAWLLADSPASRKEKLTALKKLYTLRSKIVHGARELTPDEARTQPQEAVQVALDALRVIFRDRTDLLRERTSEDRSNRLMLGD